MSNALCQQVLDEFSRYNPAKSECLSVYQPIAKDLLQYWSYSDSIDDVRACIKYLFMHYFRKSNIPVPDKMVAAIYLAKKAVR